MADPVCYGNPERDIEQALISLKKGTQLIKYSRQGKPKFRAFRLSLDETALIWLSHGEEKNVKLSSVTRIIPGQRTPVFRRYLRPEKDYLSFSLIYNNGDRSLDLICKDKIEVDVWLAGLKALIGRNRSRQTNNDASDVTSETGDLYQSGRSSNASSEFSSSIARGRVSIDIGYHDPLNLGSSDVGSEHANMQLRTSTGGDGIRISVSSTPSCSSGGSGPDDFESLGDVFVWGQVWSDLVSSDGSVGSIPIKNDVLTPKPLESNVVLDVHQIASGVGHVALVTRQGEVFAWGEECGGRLGHGIEKDFSKPRLVELLAIANIDFVACGEYHTLAVSTTGDLFAWGDGTHNAGLLGHGTDVSHWIPKRVLGTLQGHQVSSISCGSWHSALITSSGKLFTFGDGTFGVLGHGDRESALYPKEVRSLSGLKTLKVACGIWHTAAIVEVMGQAGSSVPYRSLFTWGDGDKYCLGHGNKDTHLLPTNVSSLADYNFQQLACGHTMTVALSTSGHVFTMGSPAHGQLGMPNADGKIPSLVQDKLVGEFVEEISCGAYHVVVSTSRSEVFTWGKGANGQLGHGDTEDRKVPTLVEALKDRHVKNISCGSNFTFSICVHKWISGVDQSICSGCRQAFGFTRKRHNCYNCGLVHCHACSSKKALKAALAPTPGKPHRVCDACYAKLKAAETAGNASNANRKATTPRQSMDMKDRIDWREPQYSRVLISCATEPIKYLEINSRRPGLNSEASVVQASQVPSHSQLKDIVFPSYLSALQSPWRPMPPSIPQPIITAPQNVSSSRSTSPYSRRPSPPRSTTPTFSRSVLESHRKMNEILKHDMKKMQDQIKSLKKKCEGQEMEIQKLQKQSEEASSSAIAELSKSRAAKEMISSLVTQLKEITEQLPSEIRESETFKSMNSQIEAFLNANEASESYSLPVSLEHDQQNGFDMLDDGNRAYANSRMQEVSTSTKGEKEQVEQFEPGVYVTYIQHSSGVKIFKRVKFSKKRFKEQQAEVWWKGNKNRLLKKYRSPLSSAPAGSTSSTASLNSSVATDETKNTGPSEAL